MILSEFESKVVKLLDSLLPGDVIDIETQIEPSIQAQFIEVAKLYIDAWGNCEFSNDYRCLKRILSFNERLYGVNRS